MKPLQIHRNSERGFLPTIKNLERTYGKLVRTYDKDQDIMLLESYVRSAERKVPPRIDEQLYQDALTRIKRATIGTSKSVTQPTRQSSPTTPTQFIRQPQIDIFDDSTFDTSRAQFFSPKQKKPVQIPLSQLQFASTPFLMAEQRKTHMQNMRNNQSNVVTHRLAKYSNGQ
eukprot:EST42783.1 Hypothetical protein SS50377_17550 [Spironucleus salmonicida]